MLEQSDGPEVTQAWFQGLNPQLEDRSPARLLPRTPRQPDNTIIHVAGGRRRTVNDEVVVH